MDANLNTQEGNLTASHYGSEKDLDFPEHHSVLLTIKREGKQFIDIESAAKSAVWF